MKVTITLPIPPRALHPNERVVWQAKAAAKKQARQESMLCAIKAMGEAGMAFKPQLTAAEAKIVLYNATARRHDDDNLIAWCKSYFDGFVDAGLLDDDRRLRHDYPEQYKDASNPRIEITVEEVNK